MNEEHDKDHDVTTIEEFYGTEYVANKLNIKPGTVRKYAKIIESLPNGADHFKNGDSTSRVYTSHDIKSFRDALQLKDNSGVTVVNAIKTAFAWVNESSHDADGTSQITVQGEKRDVVMTLLANQNKQMADLSKQNKELREQLDQLNEKLDSITTKLDNSTPKRSFWSRIFGN